MQHSTQNDTGAVKKKKNLLKKVVSYREISALTSFNGLRAYIFEYSVECSLSCIFL